MELNGLHLLLTYQCNFECDHCFVWGSPNQSGTMSLGQLRNILAQAQELGTIEWIYFEGGEPFLYYPILLAAVHLAVERGFKVGIVTNSYWAIAPDDAGEWLKPLAGQVHDLSVSSDLYHYAEPTSQQAAYATQAAGQLGIPIGTIHIAQPEEVGAACAVGQLPEDESGVMYRGRAADKLAGRAPQQPWNEFTACPYEDLVEPGRIHVDPLGYLHICQGISIGNLFEQPLSAICQAYQPQEHPIVGPLLDGGPAELVRRYGLLHAEGYADACHLCYTARLALRSRFPEVLLPNQMYGVF